MQNFLQVMGHGIIYKKHQAFHWALRSLGKHIMMDGEDILAGEYRKSPVFAGYHIFAPASHIERWMEDAIFRFHETIQLWPLQISLETSTSIHLMMETEEFVS